MTSEQVDTTSEQASTRSPTLPLGLSWLEQHIVSSLVASPPRNADELVALVAVRAHDAGIHKLAVITSARRLAERGVLVAVGDRWSLI